MSDYKPTPFELAATALLIAIVEKGDPVISESSFDRALELLEKANTHTPRAARDVFAGIAKRYSSFSFDELLIQVSSPQGNRKLPRTILGAITTEAGLAKAIRRTFEPEFSVRYLKERRMPAEAVARLLKDQSQRNAAKAASARGKKRNKVK